MIAQNSNTIIFTYAVVQFIVALIVVLGKRSFAMILIFLTLVHTFLMHNPFYRYTTELDRQRCNKNIFNDLCMIATLFVVTDMKKPHIPVQ